MSGSTALYSPLQGLLATRFIKLYPSSESEQLSIQLECRSLTPGSYPAYEALSYTWGEPSPTRTVSCNGQSFELRENAFLFLERLRLRDTARMVWMDCICINQDDLSERAQQVSIMNDIYEGASAVVVWLGPGDEDSDCSMSYIAQQDAHAATKDMEDPNIELNFEQKMYLFKELPESRENKRIVRALVALLSRKWFRRIWIQQEAALSRNMTVLCGSKQVAWEQLMSVIWLLVPSHSLDWPEWTGQSFRAISQTWNAMRAIQRSRSSVEEDCLRLLRHRKQDSAMVTEAHLVPDSAHISPDDWHNLRTAHPSARLLYLLTECSGCEATDPRDKVYALYGLCAGSNHFPLPKLDYTVPWQVVFIRTAKWICSSGLPMFPSTISSLLYYAGRSQRKSLDLPSWVPDIRFLLVPSLSPSPLWKAGGPMDKGPSVRLFRFLNLSRSIAGIGPLPVYSFVDKNDKQELTPYEALEVSAIMVDKVVFVSHPAPPDLEYRRDSPQLLHKIARDVSHVESAVPKYFTGEPAVRAYCATIIAGTTHQSKPSTPDYEFHGFVQWRTWLRNNLPDPDPVYHSAIEESEALTRNCFCTTSHGLMCLAPAKVMPGDFIAIFHRCKFPFALRRLDPNQHFFELLGPCYVHRMMRGRAFNLMDKFQLKYRPGSEDEARTLESSTESMGDEMPGHNMTDPCEEFPFNPKRDYRHVVRVLGERRIALV